MKIEIDAHDAKSRLADLLLQVRTGRSFTITDHGQAIADLVPSAELRAKNSEAAVEKLKAFMRTNPVRGVNIKQLIEEGRT